MKIVLNVTEKELAALERGTAFIEVRRTGLKVGTVNLHELQKPAAPVAPRPSSGNAEDTAWRDADGRLRV